MSIILAIILFILLLLWNVDRHYQKWRYGQQQPDTGNTTPILHVPETIIRIIAFIPVFALLFISKEMNVLTAIKSAAVLFFSFWLFFDGLFNLKRGRDWWFLGTVDKNESFLDNVKRKLGKTWTKIVQISGVIISLFFYIRM